MRRKIYKKILTLGITIAFLSLIVAPVIEADIKNSNSIVDLLILTPKKFSKALQPLIRHKDNYDVKTRLVTLDEVYNQMFQHGRDKPEKIKYFIKNAIEEWGVRYVLLVGGMKHQGSSWYLPARYVYMGDGWESCYVSDLYYADIYDAVGNFSSWDYDGDGRFGEWFGESAEDKNIDLYPDVSVGRLPCRNIFEVRIMVNKITYYETHTYNSDWFYNMVAAAGDTYPERLNPNWTGYEGEYYSDRVLENMTSFRPTRLYTSDGTLTGAADIIRAVNKGCGFLYLAGHGNPITWTNHLPNSTEWIDGIGIPQIMRFSNRNKLPICIVSGCHNCQFDVSIFKVFNKVARRHLEYAPECWGWWMTRKIGGGSIATIGYTALGYTKEDKESFEGGISDIELKFFQHYGQGHIDIIGETWSESIKSYLDMFPLNASDWDEPATSDPWVDVKAVQSFALFGDPSLKIGGYP